MKKVKLYIEPASLPLTLQLLNYIKSSQDNTIIHIIAFQRLRLNTEYINKQNTAFIYNINTGLEEKLSKMAGFVKGIRPESIEIHTNIHRERDILFPLMKLLAAFHPPEKISLHLYDDGSGTLIERAAIETLDSPDFDRLMEKRKQQLQAVLLGRSTREYAWNTIDNYLWHYLLETQYYFIAPPRKKKTNAFYQRLEKHVTYTGFSVLDRVTPEEKTRLLNLVNFPMALYAQLESLRADPQALLFITSYCLDPFMAANWHQRLLALINTLKNQGGIPPAAKVVFKGHPENKSNNDELYRAVGAQAVRIPDAIPVELLNAFGLLPARIGGEFSSTFFCADNIDVAFVILKGQQSDKHNQVFMDIAQRYQAFDASKLVYL
ncbi:TPA: hypothetical protein MX214_004776 [Citrobacter sedlakii]|nr:hypothetical protein [Citrobacter sedlakii]HCA7077534.1 hypothetical protein [Citrobacter sedlakii]HCA7081553.1 hypothetical protein [Citrobacter sedlakii]HCA7134877.1 hypothetical protein [Citrobacter sedlakii]HCA7138130.1 hypothetical protein [Citrobacter sedlakii]